MPHPDLTLTLPIAKLPAQPTHLPKLQRQVSEAVA